MARDGKLRLGIGLQGGGGHWRDPTVSSGAAAEFASYREYGRLGEAGKYDFGFIADSAYITRDSTWPFLSRLEPLAALSALSAVTTHLGLVGTFTTSYSYPFTTARQLASLDKISEGRAGWNAVTSALEGVARNYNGDKLHDHALRYRIADEYIDVVKGLWDSFEDDAFTRDKANDVYLDWDKMHALDHVGEFFQVQGPLNMERSPQGRPIMFQAGASEDGRDLAAKHADAIFSAFAESDDLELGKAYYRDIKSRAIAHGRSPDDILIFPSIGPIVADTQEEADALYEREAAYVDAHHAVKYLSRYFSFFDFGQFPLDEPLPELGDIGANSFKSTAEYYLRIAREEKLTLRQLAYRASNPKGGFVGTPGFVADKIQRAFEERAVDGFIIFGTHAHIGTFNARVLPILRERGLFRDEYESATLRGNLGLEYPVNRYTAARAEPALAAE
ncbi:NtaA/DmoA family FMN-dependent monooxygenase [Sphingomonas abietis]|uniref:NtaA/DmoA family FMN-dependent monooxygenase n=1 Tax=Sphingomonas abietis TaxID=3012344 RepID=A0ABY7NLL2_9SPHN|nr:NtaA/DmoA family FMN-dependent monooxygenase [Sphingomonas abietis]WBO21361.1 NtaA/DmoA family FMN-dependent monooxygenase [Sphingomonas abietis]